MEKLLLPFRKKKLITKESVIKAWENNQITNDELRKKLEEIHQQATKQIIKIINP